MRTPKITATENQIISSKHGIERYELTHQQITALVEEFHGDAEIIAICPDGGYEAVYVRLEGWSELQRGWERFWIWISTDVCDYSLAMQTIANSLRARRTT